MKKNFLAIFKQKITLNGFGQLVSHISLIKHANRDADILLIENNKILFDNREAANVFNNHFQSIT